MYTPTTLSGFPSDTPILPWMTPLKRRMKFPYEDLDLSKSSRMMLEMELDAIRSARSGHSESPIALEGAGELPFPKWRTKMISGV